MVDRSLVDNTLLLGYWHHACSYVVLHFANSSHDHMLNIHDYMLNMHDHMLNIHDHMLNINDHMLNIHGSSPKRNGRRFNLLAELLILLKLLVVMSGSDLETVGKQHVSCWCQS